MHIPCAQIRNRGWFASSCLPRVFIRQNGRKMLQFWNSFVRDITSFSRKQWVVWAPWILLRGLKFKSVRLLQRCKHPDNNRIPARRDRIHCYQNYCNALLVLAFSSFRKGIFVSTDTVPHVAQKLNIINGVRSGHLNGHAVFLFKISLTLQKKCIT